MRCGYHCLNAVVSARSLTRLLEDLIRVYLSLFLMKKLVESIWHATGWTNSRIVNADKLFNWSSSAPGQYVTEGEEPLSPGDARGVDDSLFYWTLATCMCTQLHLWERQGLDAFSLTSLLFCKRTHMQRSFVLFLRSCCDVWIFNINDLTRLVRAIVSCHLFFIIICILMKCVSC